MTQFIGHASHVFADVVRCSINTGSRRTQSCSPSNCIPRMCAASHLQPFHSAALRAASSPLCAAPCLFSFATRASRTYTCSSAPSTSYSYAPAAEQPPASVEAMHVAQASAASAAPMRPMHAMHAEPRPPQPLLRGQQAPHVSRRPPPRMLSPPRRRRAEAAQRPAAECDRAGGGWATGGGGSGSQQRALDEGHSPRCQ